MAILSTSLLTTEERRVVRAGRHPSLRRDRRCGQPEPRREAAGAIQVDVSRRLARLESNLGGRLLSRTTHGISPTEVGAEFKRSAERILADLDEACGAVAQRGDEVIGLLRIAVPLSFGLRHVAPLLVELASRHPKLRIDAAYAERAVDLVAEGFDAAVQLGRLRTPA